MNTIYNESNSDNNENKNDVNAQGQDKQDNDLRFIPPSKPGGGSQSNEDTKEITSKIEAVLKLLNAENTPIPIKGAYGKDAVDSKKPFIDQWKPFQTASPSESEVKGWFSECPKINIAIVTGREKNRFVLDVDGADGLESLKGLLLPDTWTVRTKRGFHYYFKWDQRLDNHTTTASGIRPGIDVRGDGGYVIAPPSEIFGGGKYEWLEGRSPYDLPLAEIPEWLYSWLQPKQAQERTPSTLSTRHDGWVSDALGNLQNGNRHDTVIRIAGKLHHDGYSPEEINALLKPHIEQAKTATANYELEDLWKDISDVCQRYPNSVDKNCVQKKSIQFESADSLFKEPEQPTPWLIQDVFTSGRGFIAGAPGVYKTWLGIDMAISICTGADFLGKFKVPAPGPVVFITEEESRNSLKKKLRLLAKGRGLDESALGEFHHVTQQYVKIPQNVEDIIAQIKKYGCRAVFFDVMRRVHSADENSSTALQPVLEAFSRIHTETGATVILLHHVNKPSKDRFSKSPFSSLRGSIDLWAWRDTIVVVQEKKKNKLYKLDFQFRNAPPRDAFEFCIQEDSEASLALQFNTGISIEKDEEDSLESTGGESLIKRVFEHISKHPQLGSNLVAKSVKGNRNQVLKVIKSLNADGRIRKDIGWVVSDPVSPDADETE